MIDEEADALVRREALALVVAQLLLFCWASFYRGHQGAIAAALALRAEPAFHGELLIVDAEPPVAGGAYYLRREHLALRAVEAAALPHELRGEGAQDAFVLTCRQPLDAAVVDACGLEQFGMFTGMLDLRQRDRRFLYRRRR